QVHHQTRGAWMPDCQTIALSWRKSSYSASGDCVEVAFSGGSVWVRDSKQGRSPTLEFPASQWRAFLLGIRGSNLGPTILGAAERSAPGE
ncbi:MAG: DUF397 domain-containing protein, partial [Candidatus Dormibacteraceae bacterium]